MTIPVIGTHKGHCIINGKAFHWLNFVIDNVVAANKPYQKAYWQNQYVEQFHDEKNVNVMNETVCVFSILFRYDNYEKLIFKKVITNIRNEKFRTYIMLSNTKII